MPRTFDILKAQIIRKRVGMSYADLGTHLGVTRQAVGYWFRERGEPNVQQMKEMAKAMGCHWLELVTDETMVVYKEEEIRRMERIRKLSDKDLADLDGFLAFKGDSRST